MRYATIVIGAALAGLSLGPAALVAQDELAKRSSWSAPAVADVKARLDDLLVALKADEAARLKVAAVWPDEAAALSGTQLLDAVVLALAAIDPQARELVARCQEPPAAADHALPGWLQDETQPPLMRKNLQLYFARWLVHYDLVDEALEATRGLATEEVVDPATLLFIQAVAHHRLLDKEKCLAAASRLLENEAQLPQRYATLARLMEADIKPLKVDSLDEIARLMEDIRRRLDFGRAGKKVRDEEAQVIAKLEKMIEELEQQQQQQQQQQQGGGQSSGQQQPSQPLPDSQAAQLKGPGQVDPKSLGKKDGWGNLPPKDRQEVMQQIGRELPAHFRETIEEYFKRLAQDGVK